MRQLKNIKNLATFNRFVQLCANLAGQILNRDELSRQVGVDTKTIQSWLGLMEGSYILFQLQPWHNNLNKRIVKSPKIYFHDTGLLCALLNITSKNGLKSHPMAGAVFENWCLSEIRKNRCNDGDNTGLFYFRDNMGNEIDLIVEKEIGPFAVEVKSASNPDRSLLKGLKYWGKYQPIASGILLYQGKSASTDNPLIQFASWKEIDSIRRVGSFGLSDSNRDLLVTRSLRVIILTGIGRVFWETWRDPDSRRSPASFAHCNKLLSDAKSSNPRPIYVSGPGYKRGTIGERLLQDNKKKMDGKHGYDLTVNLARHLLRIHRTSREVRCLEGSR